MLLEYKFNLRFDNFIYANSFFNALEKLNLEGKLFEDDTFLYCYVVIDENIEKFINYFDSILPNSIFLDDSEVNSVENYPRDKFSNKKELILKKSKDVSPCIECLTKVLDKTSKDYYNIFTSCNVCGYDITGKEQSYKQYLKEFANHINDGKIVKINTAYGVFNIGTLHNIDDNIDFDIMAYDIATIKKYTHVEEFEINSLASIEKPFIKLNVNIEFKKEFESISNELLRFKLSDDMLLNLLLQELNKYEVNMIFITQDDIKSDTYLDIIKTQKYIEPIEIVSSPSHKLIINGSKRLISSKEKKDKTLIECVSDCQLVIKENNLDDENIAAVYLSKKYHNSILLFGDKFTPKEYLSLNFQFTSVEDIFTQIKHTNDTGEKIIQNYKKKFPEHYNRIVNIKFETSDFNIYQFWGIMAIVLDLTKSNNIKKASKILQTNTEVFLGKKGPRIDYKLIKKNEKTVLDPLMIIRSAMSFKLAGVDNLTLSYGVIESFIEFLSSEIDNLKETMNINSVVFDGSVLKNKKIFLKIVQECSINNKIYFRR